MTSKTLNLRTVPFDYDGKTYELSPFDIEDYGRYECWLEKNLWEALRRARSQDWINDMEYREYRREAMLILAAQSLSTGTEAYNNSTGTIPGLRQQILLSLRHKHPEADEALVDQIVSNDLAGVVAALAHLNDPN